MTAATLRLAFWWWFVFAPPLSLWATESSVTLAGPFATPLDCARAESRALAAGAVVQIGCFTVARP
jgi:hypothetical protein